MTICLGVRVRLANFTKMQTNKEMIELKAKKWLNVIAINDFIKNKDGLHV